MTYRNPQGEQPEADTPVENDTGTLSASLAVEPDRRSGTEGLVTALGMSEDHLRYVYAAVVGALMEEGTLF